MDPAVPWTAYAAAASYNRLANAGSGFQASAGDYQNAALSGHQSSGQGPSTNQLILQAAHTSATLGQLSQGTSFTPTGFLSPPSVNYDAVFPSLFHHANPKAAAQAAAAAHFRKQSAESELSALHSQAPYFDHQTPVSTTAWSHQANSQLPSPFGILPHESVVATTGGPSKTTTTPVTYENTFNAAQHFPLSSLNHINSQLTDFTKGKSQLPRNPQQSYASSNSSNNNGSGQQSCIVSSANTQPKSNYRVPEVAVNRGNSVYVSQPPEKPKTPARNFTSPPAKQQASPQQPQHVPNKGPAKAEIRRSGADTIEGSQSSPISFAINYQAGSANKTVQRPAQNASQYVINQNNYRYSDGEYRKTGSADSAYSSGSNGPECNAAVPRRPSPLQAHSQPSPLSHASSPAYPIYNSPSGISQVTPPSPLDVSVSRASAVAYPSVITRAEGRWETENRNNGQNAQANQTRAKYGPGYALDAAQVQRIPALSITERQQAYFDNTPASGDLSACRGDPMTIVKNLQNLQNCNSMPAETPKLEELRPTPKNSQKGRRKSGDKQAEGTDMGRVPPPAHLNNPAPQQPQNGGFFDMERWVPPKVFHQQGLIAPHPHHAAPPLPYFTPFHLAAPGHHPHPQEFHPSVDITPVAYGEQFNHAEVKEASHKVVVPDVEEECKHLSQEEEHARFAMVASSQAASSSATALPPPIRNPDKKPQVEAGSGFMASYVKFLQGDRGDTSPPPPARVNRKPVWNRNKVYPPELISTPAAASSTSNIPAATTTTPARITAEKKGNEKPYNVDDDPRFYPLPKSTARRKLDSDSSDEEKSAGRKTYTTMKNVTTAQLAKLANTGQAPHNSHSPKKPGRPPSSKKKADELPTRREAKRRKAKDKISIKGFVDKQAAEDDPDVDDPDFVDSDTDPMWMPGAKADSDEEKGRKKKPMRLSKTPGKRRDSSSSDEEGKRGRKRSKHRQSHTADNPDDNDPSKSTDSDAIYSKKSKDREKKDKNDLAGEFVVMKSDMHEEYPPIWRIDGKTLLQKYEPFDENGITLYRNISTYSGWTAQNRHIYVTVPVKFRVQTRMETVVELLRDQMTIEDPELMQRVMKDLEKYQDPFEVYIQTLISQSLDANFLSEILMEQDEYFLTNVKKIDDVTDDHCRRLLNVAKWRQHLITSLKTFPALNITQDIPKEMGLNKPCAGCDKIKVSMRIQVYGQPYNPTTLESIQADPKITFEKDWLLCSACGWRVSLFSKATHQKYLMYIECAKRVADKRAADTSKDTTIILNELLADESWLHQLFLDVRKSWAEIEKIEHLSCESNKQLLQNAVASAGIS